MGPLCADLCTQIVLFWQHISDGHCSSALQQSTSAARGDRRVPRAVMSLPAVQSGQFAAGATEEPLWLLAGGRVAGRPTMAFLVLGRPGCSGVSSSCAPPAPTSQTTSGAMFSAIDRA